MKGPAELSEVGLEPRRTGEPRDVGDVPPDSSEAWALTLLFLDDFGVLLLALGLALAALVRLRA